MIRKYRNGLRVADADNQCVLRCPDQMFWSDHAPHFHALYAEFEALIDIRTLEVIREIAATCLGIGAGVGGAASRRTNGGLKLCEAKQHPRKIAPLE